MNILINKSIEINFSFYNYEICGLLIFYQIIKVQEFEYDIELMKNKEKCEKNESQKSVIKSVITYTTLYLTLKLINFKSLVFLYIRYKYFILSIN